MRRETSPFGTAASMLCLVLLGLASLLSGCAKLDERPSLDPAMVLQPGRAYLYGRFELTRASATLGTRLLLQLTDMATGESADIQFHEAPQEIYVIDVLPSEYEFTQLVFAPSGATEAEVRRNNLRVPSRMSFFAQPFDVEAGKAYYVGDWTGVIKRDFDFYVLFSKVTLRWGLTRLLYDYDGATAAMRRRYPALDRIEARAAWSR
jgi:hypothetical protein